MSRNSNMPALSENKSSTTLRTVVRKLDVRIKMAICVLSSLVVIPLESLPALSFLALGSLVYLLMHDRFKETLFCYSFLVLIAIIAVSCLKVMCLFIPGMDRFPLLSLGAPFLRVAVVMNVVIALVVSSRIQEILTALKSMRLPFFLYLPAVVMVRFLPTFVSDIRQIAESLKIRGYRINPLTLTFHPLLMARFLFVPIAIRALRNADQLAIAAELKGIGLVKKITPYGQRRMVPSDYYMALSWLLLISAAFVVEYQGPALF